MFKHFMAVFAARNREFFRDTSSWAWNVIFPVMLVIALTFAFSDDNKTLYRVSVLPSVDKAALPAFFATKHIQFLDAASREEAETKVERHLVDMLIDLDNERYLINDTNTNGYMLERVLAGTGGGAFTKETVSSRAVRYVDWVIPGVMGMNIMFASLFGVGYVIVRYRKNGMLKRLKATPLTAFEFLAAQVASRLWLILLISSAVYAGTNFFLHFTMNGSYLNLFLLFALGSVCLISLGLVVAARTSSEELAGGLLNMLTWPMMLLSGVWFSMEGAHPWLQKLAWLFPLTHITEGARAIMIDGVGFTGIAPHLIFLAVLSALFLALGSKLFRWDQH